MKSVVITGASGFIGKALTVKFLNDGYDVYGVIKNRKEKEHLPKHIRIHPIICDFSDYENLSSYIHENIEYFVHFPASLYQALLDMGLGKIFRKWWQEMS